MKCTVNGYWLLWPRISNWMLEECKKHIDYKQREVQSQLKVTMYEVYC